MPTGRVFTDEELRIAALRSVDAVSEAVEAGDLDAARSYLKRLRREAASMKGNYDAWEASLVGWLRRRSGAHADEALASLEGVGGALPEVDEATPDFVARWRAMERDAAATLEAGAAPEAVRIAEDLHAEALRVHDRGMARVAALLSWIGRRYAPEALEEAYVEAMGVDLLGDASFRERAEALMHFTRVHLQPFALEEDDEKLCFVCPVCPSGGRLLREGHYDPPDGAIDVQGPSWLTWGRDSLPIYCCHEPVMERSSAQQSGVPLFVVEPSERLGEEPCRTYLYKDPADIPERYYARLGLEKPKRGEGDGG